MKSIQCPWCEKEIKVRTKLSMTVDTGEKKETIPREVLTKILVTYFEKQNQPFNDFNRKIHSKHAKQFWLDLDKNLDLCLELIVKGSEHAANEGWKSWSWNALKKHKDSIMAPLKTAYDGW